MHKPEKSWNIFLQKQHPIKSTTKQMELGESQELQTEKLAYRKTDSFIVVYLGLSRILRAIFLQNKARSLLLQIQSTTHLQWKIFTFT